MTVPFDLLGSVAVITGAGSGIGRATAISFARRGARLAVSDIDAARADETASLARDAGADVIAVPVDVASTDDFERLRDRCLDEFGRVDVVMNNVGVLAMGPPETIPVEAWQRTLDLNLISVARSNLVFLPLLLAEGRGHIVNTASASGLLAYGYDRLPYVASKHALVGVSEALALYLGPHGIGVTCVCPSGVATNIVEQISVHGSSTSMPRAPDHPIVEADVVGELVADAVRDGTFLVLTVPEIAIELRDRADDIEGYLRRLLSREAG